MTFRYAFLVILSLAASSAAAQEAAVTEVLIEARVLAVPAELLKIEPSAMANDPAAKTVHRLELRTAVGRTTHLRVDSRVPAALGSPEYFEIGLGIEITPEVFPTRDVLLRTSSEVQVRRGPVAGAALAPMVFESSPVHRDVQAREGETILLKDFLSESEARSLPSLPRIEGNSLLGYLHGDTELVVLLTPRILGPVHGSKEPPTGRYTVQVGAFENPANAETLATELRKKHPHVSIEKTGPGLTLYGVRVGRLPDRAATDELQEQLSAQGFESFVVTLDSRALR